MSPCLGRSFVPRQVFIVFAGTFAYAADSGGTDVLHPDQHGPLEYNTIIAPHNSGTLRDGSSRGPALLRREESQPSAAQALTRRSLEKHHASARRPQQQQQPQQEQQQLERQEQEVENGEAAGEAGEEAAAGEAAAAGELQEASAEAESGSIVQQSPDTGAGPPPTGMSGSSGPDGTPDVIIVGNETDDPRKPAWARVQQLMAGRDRLPWQPNNCTYFIDADAGDSDHGSQPHPLCEACRVPCTAGNGQAPIKTRWNFLPKLDVKPAFDIVMMVEFPNVQQLAPFSENGIFHKMQFEVSRMRGPGFGGYMGPQVHGGVGPGEALPGLHTFIVRDTRLPSPDGLLVRDRWLAVPGTKNPGDIGTCRRTCVDCEKHPEIMASGLDTGVMCTVDVGIMDGQAFVYQLRQSKGAQTVLHADRATASPESLEYKGSEWVVTVRDTSTGAYYEVGRVVLEGTSADDGIKGFSAEHAHIGCSPCDAYFQAARVTGPFILSPGMHQITTCHSGPAWESAEHARYSRCDLHRVVGLGGYTLLYESGPGVWPASTKKDMAKVYACNYFEDLQYTPNFNDDPAHVVAEAEVGVRPGGEQLKKAPNASLDASGAR